MTTPTVSSLLHPIHAGDWHDKPLRYLVTNNTTDANNRQLFSTFHDAKTFARLWRKTGDIVAAGKLFARLPL